MGDVDWLWSWNCPGGNFLVLDVEAPSFSDKNEVSMVGIWHSLQQTILCFAVVDGAFVCFGP